jgi:hypothetical protein
MNAVEQSVLNTIRRRGTRSGASGRYRVRVGSVEITTRASNEAEAVKRASQWHSGHIARLDKKGLRHVGLTG